MVRCPWFPSALKPNSRTHWGLKARATKSYRHTCAVLAKEQGLHLRKWPEGKISVHLAFYPPNNHRPDDDNLEAAFKAGRDGVADAMGVDDHRFEVTRSVHDKVDGGCVIVRIGQYPEGAG